MPICIDAINMADNRPRRLLFVHYPEMGETAIQPEPAQTADLSISGLHSVAPPCIHFIKETSHKG